MFFQMIWMDLEGPQNIPNQDLIKENLEKPLSSIPDPFRKI